MKHLNVTATVCASMDWTMSDTAKSIRVTSFGTDRKSSSKQ
ncbi:hypothetical protein [Vibrio sp. SCSIO 43135]|nr:hypothetical protein [Vibrio sp. SCSIO 43135]